MEHLLHASLNVFFARVQFCEVAVSVTMSILQIWNLKEVNKASCPKVTSP